MKRKLLIITVLTLIFGTTSAQQHYQFNYHQFEHSWSAIVQIQIDGVEQTSTDIELGAFDGETVTGSGRIEDSQTSTTYYRVYMTIWFNNVYETSFKIYNHGTGEELSNCEITYLGEPYTIELVDDQYIGSNKKPLVLNFKTSQTFTKEIAGYGDGGGKWYLIASPVEGSIAPSEVTNLLGQQIQESNLYNYDLYRFNQSADKEWENYHQHNSNESPFMLENGKGYLYARKQNATLTFTGTPVEASTFSVSLAKDDDAYLAGFNLVGNPFFETAYIDRDFYVMNDDGTEIFAATAAGIEPMQGVFVIASEDNETLSFSTTNPNAKNSMLAINLGQGRGNIIDRAIVRFGECRTLPKLQIGSSSSKVCFPKDGQDYAVVAAENAGELPVSFQAAENGTYTIAVSTENVGFGYLHLIDNLTGTDTDLLATPAYTFEACKSDYASRFRLVFSANDAEDNDNFAYFNGSEWVINASGNAIVQVIDMMGRVIVSESATNRLSMTGMSAGVYTLCLIVGDEVKTQKIVVK